MSRERITRLSAALGAYARKERVHLPVLDEATAARIAAASHDAVDAATGARARAIARDGATLACAAGCSACCENVIMVYAPEAALVAEWLERPANAAARARFVAKLPGWYERAGEAAALIRALHGRGRLRDAERVYGEVQQQRVMCAFNHEGRCEVYPVRPNVCRNTHALDTPERCLAGASPGPTVMAFEPVDELMEESHPLLRTAQVALRREAAPEAMCAAVHTLLVRGPVAAAPPPSRNAPCPCGSGEKWKRCCGE